MTKKYIVIPCSSVCACLKSKKEAAEAKARLEKKTNENFELAMVCE